MFFNFRFVFYADSDAGSDVCSDVCSDAGTDANALVPQTIEGMIFGSDDSDGDSKAAYTPSQASFSDPYLSDLPSSSEESANEEEDMIPKVPTEKFNKLFKNCTDEVLLEKSKHKLARQRKVLARNAAKRPRTRKHKVDKSSEKTAPQRATEFAHEGMIVQAGQLWCGHCNTQVMRKCCSIKQHCKTARHQRHKEKKERDTARDAAIRAMISFACLSSTLNEETLLHRANVCRAFLQEGVSFELLRNPFGLMRGLLQHHRGTVSRNETMEMIPMLLAEEIKKITEEIIDAKHISFSFDGTTDVAELLGVIIRFVCGKGLIHQRCAALNMYRRSFNGDELTRAIIAVLTTRYAIPFERWHYATRDGCAVNGAAVRNMTMLNPKLLDLICWSHSVNVAGKVFNEKCEAATRFMQWWAQLISRSAAARGEFKEGAGEAALRLSDVRWFSAYELFVQLFHHLSVVEAIVRGAHEDAETPSGALKAHMREVFDDVDALRVLKLELAAVVENAVVFVKTCYLLEGDDFLAPLVYDQVNGLLQRFAHLTSPLPRAARSPMLWVTIEAEVADPLARNETFDTVLAKLLPAFLKFQTDIDINGRLYSTWIIFRGCRLLNFRFVAHKEVVVLSAECVFLRRLPVVPETALNGLRAELDEYHALAVDHDQEEDLWSFWRQYQLRLPVWYALACNIALIMTSSASVERLFSLYEGRFSDQQQGALEDYKEASIMLHYNELQRAKYN